MRFCVTVSQKLWALRFLRLSCLVSCDLSASQFHSLFFCDLYGGGFQVPGFRYQEPRGYRGVGRCGGMGWGSKVVTSRQRGEKQGLRDLGTRGRGTRGLTLDL
jgi:hypothetical protein